MIWRFCLEPEFRTRNRHPWRRYSSLFPKKCIAARVAATKTRFTPTDDAPCPAEGNEPGGSKARPARGQGEEGWRGEEAVVHFERAWLAVGGNPEIPLGIEAVIGLRASLVPSLVLDLTRRIGILEFVSYEPRMPTLYARTSRHESPYTVSGELDELEVTA